MAKQIPENSVGIVRPVCLHFDEPLPLRSGKVIESYDLQPAIMIRMMKMKSPAGGKPVSAPANRLIPTGFLLSA